VEYKPEDKQVRRAFDAENTGALRTLTIRLGGREAGVTMIDGKFVFTERLVTVVDPVTKKSSEIFDFTKAVEIKGEMWMPIYILSLGSSPMNMFRRIVESSETLGKAFLEATFESMVEKKEVVQVFEVKTEHMILLTMLATFDQGFMPQLGDHFRSARDSIKRANEAFGRGEWLEAYLEFLSAKGALAQAALEVLPVPAGKAGKIGTASAKQIVGPATDSIQSLGRNLGKGTSQLRTAARNVPEVKHAERINRVADQLDEVKDVSSKIQRIEGVGKRRPQSFPVAARDKDGLENYFGAENVRPLDGRDTENVLVVTGPKGEKQVWVRPQNHSSEGTIRKKYASYRDAFQKVQGEIPDGFDVDHVQSQARAGQQGYSYVRLELVNSNVNQAWGRTMEQCTVKAGRRGHVEPRELPDVRSIDQFQWWKLQGITPERVAEALKSRSK